MTRPDDTWPGASSTPVTARDVFANSGQLMIRKPHGTSRKGAPLPDAEKGLPACCPFCLSTDPNKVGVEQATGKVCRDPFHCPIPESHSDQPGGVFRYCQYCDYSEPVEPEQDDTFIGSLALITALHETYVEHIGITETDGPDGPYLWCACGWRSDDLDGQGTRSDNPGMSYAVHLTNAQHAAAVKALQPIVRRVIPPGEHQHEWAERGGGPDDRWHECWTCGQTRDIPPTKPAPDQRPEAGQ